ncbi:cupin domain-containing protein [Reinekea thalattae]|uniref:Cupin domain-containing protein n=1 Tax=Reinekea thalattae TaxID=2593301 RepID=A0A5C8Z699_9GAMM|nr:cupin domain-containing protein [Reinekea thalattae]TXR53147.1 cupin domain-containing protein [Reinekea thalattae]
MKKALLLTTVVPALIAIATSQASAEDHTTINMSEHGHFVRAQQPFQQATPVPYVTSPYAPQDTMPEQCSNPTIEAYIKDWEAGKVNFETIKSDKSIPKENQGCLTIDDDGNVLEAAQCSLDNAPVGYLWKELSDWPVTIGITNGKPSDHAPHFHGQPECYYAVSGRARTLSQGKYQWMETGQYFYIPGNTIHNTPIEDPSGFGVFYWYPKNGNFSGFKYYWIKDVQFLRPAEEAFAEVNEWRKESMGLGPYGTNVEYFAEKLKAYEGQ